ncbi:DUF397 domain-containing protein [Streptomyces sp. DT20]|uniref:DUF397 domain-containing protein n=1 Tax=unclassified Streptomyces TaxID=2593676 RepID=UPI002E2DE8AA|nr:DUF397 domain-containing protein [Streptomyces sp. NBC_00304]WRZ11868.1 DUF397 domain-containing protein [Streptomyces sp. NBC_00341]
MTSTPDLEAAAWRKSSYSGQGGDCIEVAGLTARTAVRDSKNPTGPALILGNRAWAAFVEDAKQPR